jgi:hypothetical protein
LDYQQSSLDKFLFRAPDRRVRASSASTPNPISKQTSECRYQHVTPHTSLNPATTAYALILRFDYCDLAGTKIDGFFLGGKKWVRSVSSCENTWSRAVSTNLNLWGFPGRQGHSNLCHSGAPATFSMYAPLL